MVMEKLEALSRRLLGNRRRHARRRQAYDTIVRDAEGKVLFRGRVKDLSRSGARVLGLPTGTNIQYGQRVCAEFLLLPKDLAHITQRTRLWGRVCRIEETEDESSVAITFEHFLAE